MHMTTDHPVLLCTQIPFLAFRAPHPVKKIITSDPTRFNEHETDNLTYGYVKATVVLYRHWPRSFVVTKNYENCGLTQGNICVNQVVIISRR